MSKYPQIICIIILLISMWMVNGQVPQLGTCPSNDAMDNFDLLQYMGKWYEAERYFTVFEIGAKCVTAVYSANENGTVGVLNSQVNKILGTNSSIEGYAYWANDQVEAEKRAELKVVFSSLPFPAVGDYWVLGTDYTSYSVVWACQKVNLIHFVFCWILTRDRKPSVETMQKAYSVIDKNHISRQYFYRTDQLNCPDDY